MANASETVPDTATRPQVGACGSCTYVYNRTDGCYHRQSFGCTGNCTCSAMICGLGSQILQRLFPTSANATVGVVLSCSASGSDEESCANSLLDLVGGLAAKTTFWKRATIGLGVLSGLLAIGLVVALVYR